MSPVKTLTVIESRFCNKIEEFSFFSQCIHINFLSTSKELLCYVRKDVFPSGMENMIFFVGVVYKFSCLECVDYTC
jgi:hypothetical protein